MEKARGKLYMNDTSGKRTRIVTTKRKQGEPSRAPQQECLRRVSKDRGVPGASVSEGTESDTQTRPFHKGRDAPTKRCPKSKGPAAGSALLLVRHSVPKHSKVSGPAPHV